MTDDPSPKVPRPIRPKYQVFISSTFGDLQADRTAVAWEILKLGHIPTGMENFSADPDRGWKVIQKTIDRSDYYVLVLAGRYGTAFDQKTGVSWTEHEYDYAYEQKIPVIAFIKEDSATTSDKTDRDKLYKRLKAFKAKVTTRHLVERWTASDDLRARVAAALSKKIQEDEDEGSPRPGWYRGGAGASPAVAEELAKVGSENRDLRVENDRLKAQLTREREQTTFEVAVVDPEGTPLPTPLFALAYRRDSRDALGAFGNGSMERLGAEDPQNIPLMKAFNEQIDQYLAVEQNARDVEAFTLTEALPKCTRIGFVIRSVAGPTTNDVRCTITFPEGFVLHAGRVREGSLPSDAPRRPKLHRPKKPTAVRAFDEMFLATARPVLPEMFVESFASGLTARSAVTAEGNRVTLWLKKLQHGTETVLTHKDDLVAVLPPWGDSHVGELSYRIQSDDAKPQEG